MRSSVLLPLAACLLAACGGGGGGSAGADLAIPSDAAKSGSVAYDGTSTRMQSLSSAEVVPVGHVRRPSTGFPPPIVPPYDAVRGIYAFPLSGIPAGARILEARFRVAQVGALPGTYAALGGAVVVDHIALGTDLDPSDYASAPLAAFVGPLSTDETVGTKSLDVTSEVQADVDAGRAVSAFRLHFPGAAPGVGPSAELAAFNNNADSMGTGEQTPVLYVRYE